MQTHRRLLFTSFLLFGVFLTSCTSLKSKRNKNLFDYKEAFSRNKKVILNNPEFNFQLPSKYLIDFSYGPPPMKVQLAYYKRTKDSLETEGFRVIPISQEWSSGAYSSKIDNSEYGSHEYYKKCDSISTLNHIISKVDQEFYKYLSDSLNYISTDYTGNTDITEYDKNMQSTIFGRQKDERQKLLLYLSNNNWTKD